MEKEGYEGRVVDGDRGRGSGEIDILYMPAGYHEVLWG